MPWVPSAASNLLRCILPAGAGLLMADDIDMGHTRALLPLDSAPDPGRQPGAAKLSVPETEKLVTADRRSGKRWPRHPTAICRVSGRNSPTGLARQSRSRSNKKKVQAVTLHFRQSR